MGFITGHDAEVFINDLDRLDAKVDIFNQYVNVANEQIKKYNSNVGHKKKKRKARKKTSLKNDLINQTKKKKQQSRYNDLLNNSVYNRRVADYRNNNYLSAGEEIGYLININNGKLKYVYGYNFNHTLSPLYIKRNAKLDILKLSNINDVYLERNTHDIFFYVTLTMPNIEIDECDIDKQVESINELLKYGNNVINNLNKKIQKDYRVKGIIKKFECTFKENHLTQRNEAHPHYHLLIAVDNKSYYDKKLTKGDTALRECVRDYWIEKFVLKKFPGTLKRDAQGGFNWKRANPKTISVELAGYQGKSAKADFLLNQDIFDFAYQLFYRKRILTFVGEFKEINKELKLDKLDSMVENEEDIEEVLQDIEDGVPAEDFFNEKGIERDNKRLQRYKDEYTHYMGFSFFNGNHDNGYRYTCIKEVDDDFTLEKPAYYPKS